MITVQKSITLPDTYPLGRLGRLEELLFFDIETTGFSGEHSQLYLIGCTCFRDGSWQLLQWFADAPDAEKTILTAFFEFLKQFTAVVHFNGDGFDIPYLLKRCRVHGLDYDFSAVQSVDIYRRIKPYRSLLGLESLKQKSIERFLGIFREDQYNGGQLIEVYHAYLHGHDDRLYDMLMLHNREDLEGMPLILPILNYPDLLEHDFTLLDQTIREVPDLFGDMQPALILRASSAYDVPVDISRTVSIGSCTCHLSISGSTLSLEIELCSGTLKHFYPDYRNYYYLPFEDTAIHKSVGEYVERSAREKATPQNCYTKKTGVFLPGLAGIQRPEFKIEYKDKVSYLEYEETLFANPEDLNRYLHGILKFS